MLNEKVSNAPWWLINLNKVYIKYGLIYFLFMVVVMMGVGSFTCKLMQLFEIINATPHSNSFCPLFFHSLSYLTHLLSLSTNFLLSLILSTYTRLARLVTLILHFHYHHPLPPSHTISLLTLSQPHNYTSSTHSPHSLFSHGGPCSVDNFHPREGKT